MFGPQGNNLNLKAYKIDAGIFLIGMISLYPES